MKEATGKRWAMIASGNGVRKAEMSKVDGHWTVAMEPGERKVASHFSEAVVDKAIARRNK